MAGRERPAWVVEARLDQEGWEWEPAEQAGVGRKGRRRAFLLAIRRIDYFIAQGHDVRIYHEGEPVGFYSPYCDHDRSPVKGLRLRIRNVETGDILTYEQAQTITTSFHFPLIPEVLEAFFAANRKALNTSTEREVLPGSPE